MVGSSNHVTEKDIPSDVVYATSTNIDKAAINDGIFAAHLQKTHSSDESIQPPKHTICIKASNLKFKETREKGYCEGSQQAKDTIYVSCGEGQVSSSDNKRHDPLLKLYKGRPLCINQNINVERCIANRAMCKFIGINLIEGGERYVETILIDGYCVNWKALCIT